MRRLLASPALRAPRDAGLSYEKVRLLSRLPDSQVAAWVPRTRTLTCVELRVALTDRDDTQLRAAGGPRRPALTWEIGPRHARVDLRRWLGLEAAPGAQARAA